jgi:acyl dehydratase
MRLNLTHYLPSSPPVVGTAAVTACLLVESMPFAGGLISLGVEISWPLPTRAGDQPSVATEVIGDHTVALQASRGVVTLLTETQNQRGEIVQALVANVMACCRPH